ncbi:geranylgeranylglyceryl phosphate synthase-like protein [Listeria floridensis FSL S10-1187]|uniref:Geranylgeranylglyceryl phosphate synthase-like protein n=1 Tax=Listeria floridensis FSL S10-1187 TaxID=1265817 RepID=A0ABP3AXM6_9LIST|nr:heptaprenylglyceryl phosphate synthase [Listeria floridensis]EUJ29198.1 geranylgeranylglyceryl phosphate synthase-like protein [Listeria floridensis FSL S10-1187]
MAHFFKIDPAKPLSEREVEALFHSSTDGFIIGGTDQVTAENTAFYYERLMETDKQLFLEISHAEMVLPYADQFLVPMVLNSPDAKWVVGKFVEALREFSPHVPFKRITPLGYVILNAEAKAAKLTRANAALEKKDITAYAELAEHFLKLPVLYIEYSGTFGDTELVREAKAVLKETKLWYGGGIKSREQAAEMHEYADAIVVGNLIYENFEEALKTAEIVR